MARPTIRRYLRHRLTLRRRTGGSQYTGGEYEDVLFWGRYHDSTSLIRSPAGVEAMSGARVSMVEEVSTQDLIVDPEGRDRKVIQVDTATDTRGRFSHRVAYLS